MKIVLNDTGIPLLKPSSQFSPPVEHGDTISGVVRGSGNVATESLL